VPHPHPHPTPENTQDEANEHLSENAYRQKSQQSVKFNQVDLAPCSGDEDPEIRGDDRVDRKDWLNRTGVSFDVLPATNANLSEGSDEDRALGSKRGKGSVDEGGSKSNADRGSVEAGVGRGSHKQKAGDMFGSMNQDYQLDKEDYNVAMYYYETGCCQWIARSDPFANITLAVIGLNAIYIGIDADNNNAENLLDAAPGFIACENIFCTYFSFEWLMRYGAFRRKRDGLKDKWFVFDTCLVGMMVLETWCIPFIFSGGTGIPTGLVKMLRLLRLARMARMMRAFPDLMAMIKGVGVASRAVGSALLMLLLLVYVFAIMMFTLLKDETEPRIEERFNRLGLVMWTLLIDGAFMDGIGYISRGMIDTGNYAALVVLTVFVLCSALTVMNMLIGVLCQVVSAVAESEKEAHAISIVKHELLNMLREMDDDGSGMISRDEIGAVLHNQQALDTLASLNVDVTVLMDQLEMRFEAIGELTIHAIMDLILMLRGDRPPTMKDLLESQAFSRWVTHRKLSAIAKLGKETDGDETDGSGTPQFAKPTGSTQEFNL
jgi:voltage-gated sodium channel